MKNIAIVSNESKDIGYALTSEVIYFLIDNDCNCYLEEKIDSLACDGCYRLTDVTLRHCDFILVIGGDGTLLNAIASYARYKIPFLGINLGRIGFLADFSQNNYRENLQEVICGKYDMEERMMVQLMSGRKSYGNALNEIIFRHNQGSGVGEFKIFVDNTILTHYTGDGVLVAAPTGSTAYSLSAGGPIVNPNCEIMIIQPISPHSLNNRSVIVSTSEKVSIEFDPNETSVFLDGIHTQTNGNLLTVSKSNQTVKFIRIKNYNFYNLLFEKLKQANHTRGGLA